MCLLSSIVLYAALVCLLCFASSFKFGANHTCALRSRTCYFCFYWIGCCQPFTIKSKTNIDIDDISLGVLHLYDRDIDSKQPQPSQNVALVSISHYHRYVHISIAIVWSAVLYIYQNGRLITFTHTVSSTCLFQMRLYSRYFPAVKQGT